MGADALVETLNFLEGEFAGNGASAPRGTAGAGAATGLAPSKKIFIPPVPQDSQLATYCPKISREDARVDWSRPRPSLRDVPSLHPVAGPLHLSKKCALEAVPGISPVREMLVGARGSRKTFSGHGPRGRIARRRRVRRRRGRDRHAAGGRPPRAACGRVRARRARRARRALGLMAGFAVRPRAGARRARTRGPGRRACGAPAGRARARSSAA